MALRGARTCLGMAAMASAVLAGCAPGTSAPASLSATSLSAGSASAASVSATSPPAVRDGVLVVHVTMTGGPLRRDGTMALNHSPAPGQDVVATGRTTVSMTTDASGYARLTLPLGTYRLRTGCSAERIVRVTGPELRIDAECIVP